MVLPQLSVVQTFLKNRKYEVKSEGLIRAAHFYGTSILLVVCFVSLACKEFVSGTSSVIDCVPPSSNVPTSVINNWCYSNGIYAVDGSNEEYSLVYQWVLVMLCIQGVMFYLPHLLYNYVENGKIKWILSGVDGWVMEKESCSNKAIADYMIETLGTHRNWCMKLILVYFVKKFSST